jgi:hypothetical protein
MWEAFIWAVAVVILGGACIYVANNRVKDFLALNDRKQSRREDEDRVELEERENTAKLQKATASERAEQEKAKLLQEAAEARAAAKVAEAPETIAARIAEEEKVIAGRAEGRAIAARERATREHDASDVPALVDAYKAFLDESLAPMTFGQWLGSIDINNFR